MNTKDKVLGALRGRTNEYVSGSQIASHLNISRNAVWKAIEQLRADGYKISAVTHKGYRLLSLSDKLVPDIIFRYLKELGVAESELAPVYFYNELPSTNEKAKEYIMYNAPHGTSVIARLQTEGPCEAAKLPGAEADCIYMSIILDPERLTGLTSCQIIPMCVVSVHNALKKQLGISCLIRDFDNLYHMGRQIGEIFTEGAGQVKGGVAKLKSIVLRIALYGRGLPWNRSLLTAQILKNIIYDKTDTAAMEQAYNAICV